MENEWDNEPNEFIGDNIKTGYKIAITRHPNMQHLNGYVGVPFKHEMYRRHYDDVPVRAHGGLTYGSYVNPITNKEDGLWWIGFDCAHTGDLVPFMTQYATFRDDTYRNWSYVMNECNELAYQLKEIEDEQRTKTA